MLFSSNNKPDAIKIDPPYRKLVTFSNDLTRFDHPFWMVFDSLVYIGRATDETWYTPCQYHDHFELCYIAEGKGWFALEDTIYEVSKGDIFVTKPGEVHYGAANGTQSYILYAFGFQLYHLPVLEASYYQLGLNRTAQDTDGYIKRYCDRIMDEIQQDSFFSLEMVQSLLTELLVVVMRYYQKQRSQDEPKLLAFSPLIRQVLNLIHSEANYMTRIDVLAQSLHISRPHLDREFKRVVGISLGEYIREIVIDRAKYHLRQAEESVTAISEKLHFDTVNAFSIFLKRHTGMSPQEYRHSIFRSSKENDEKR